MSRMLVVVAALGAAAVPGTAQNVHPTPPPDVRAVPLDGAIQVDGRLDEAVWRTAPAATDFRQVQPREGQPATQRTEVRFVFDAAALYVGARMFDDQGAAGVRTRLARRDGEADADYVHVVFDTFHDHIGRLFFQVNPSGVRYDASGLGGGEDKSWDPVWEVKTTIDSFGWTAEMRIPFSQLRYATSGEEQTWGLQIRRRVTRLNERSQWAFWGLTETGGPPRFGHLTGLVIHSAPDGAEFLPYVVGRSANVPVLGADTADPFRDPHVWDGRMGVDARILLTSNLTVNATVNPDFGQVEVDPAVVNISAFETSLAERRPFFVEGAGYFGLGGSICFFCSNSPSLSMLSTRRIGRRPQVAARRDTSHRYADVPESAAILGAAKLTGRMPSGWSVGALHALTRRERATVQLSDSSRIGVTVEPFTHYFVGRVAKDLRGGATVFRAMATSVIRHLDDSFLRRRLSRRAETFGVSTDMWFGKREYRLMAQLAGSQVSGDSAAILRVQHAPARYFQRPDRRNGSNGVLSDAYDSSLTALRGLGGYARLARDAGNLLWEVSTNVRTPGFDNNDITFFSRADYWYMGGNVQRQWTKPTTWYRHLSFTAGGQQEYNFDRDLTDRAVHLFGYIQPLNYWNASGFWIHRPSVFSDRLSRGGPVLRRPSLDVWSANVETDGRKPVLAQLAVDVSCNGDGFCDRRVGLDVQIRLIPYVSFSLGSSFGDEDTGYELVEAVRDTTAGAFDSTRYVFADVLQQDVAMNTRFHVQYSPNLTFELFLQPFIASARYTRYQEYAAPRSLDRLVYGVDVGTVSITPGDRSEGIRDWITIDPDGGGPADPLGFEDPSFTVRSLRGNAVLRWEYRPGSTLFIVWTRNGFSERTRGFIDAGRDVGALFRGPSANIFLIKFNFWLGF